MKIALVIGQSVDLDRFHLLSAPEKAGAGDDAAALIGFLEQFRSGQCAIRSQRFSVLLAKTRHLFKCGHDERDGGQL